MCEREGERKKEREKKRESACVLKERDKDLRRQRKIENYFSLDLNFHKQSFLTRKNPSLACEIMNNNHTICMNNITNDK